MNAPSLEQVKQEAVQLVSEHIDGVYYLALTGSIVTGAFRLNSDIDVIVLREGVELDYNFLTLTSDRLGGITIEVGIYSYFRLIQRLDLAKYQANPALLTEFINALPLVDELGIHPSLKQLSWQYYNAGPAPISAPMVANIRHKISDLINELEVTMEPCEEVAVQAQLAVLSLEGTLIAEGQWRGAQAKWQVRNLVQSDTSESDYFLRNFQSFLQDKTQAIQLAHKTLTRLGGELNHAEKLSL